MPAPTSVDRAEREAWAVLATATGVGPIGMGRLLRRHGSAQAVLALAGGPNGARSLVSAGLPADEAAAAEPGGRFQRAGLDPEVAAGIVAAALDRQRLLDQIAELQLDVMTLDDADYPPLLLGLEMPPPVLFVRGNRAALSAPRSTAVVGTRRPTDAGRRLAAEIGSAISNAGGVVVSGLALGIDGAAHAGAVRSGASTVAVLGTGHGVLYPRAHVPLADSILGTGGCVISELAPGTPGNRGTFPRRNRIISGLAEATVVVEAPRGSGALITAGWALEQGRECFLVPGPIGSHESAGCLDFLRAYHGQAQIVASVGGLLEDLGFLVAIRPPARPSSLHLGATEERLASLVMDGHTTVDSLVAATGLPVSSVLSGLTLLEMRGLVAAAYGRYRAHGILLPAVEPAPPPRPHDAAITRSRAAPGP